MFHCSLVAFLLLVAMPFVPSSFLFLVVRPGAPSSVLAPSRFLASEVLSVVATSPGNCAGGRGHLAAR